MSELQPGLRKTTASSFELPEDATNGALTLVVPAKGFWGIKTARVRLK